MMRFGCLRGSGWVLVLAWVPIAACLGQTAKQLDDEGGTKADQCAGLKLVCRAAAMDKKYQKHCDEFKVSLNQSSNRNLASGYEKMDAKLYPTASLYAGRVCDYDPELASKKRELQDLIKKAQEVQVVQGTTPPVAPPIAPKDEVSPVKAAEAERAFASGDFDAATAAARLVADKSLQARTDPIVQKIASYNSAMQEGRQKEGGDPQGAIQSYRGALSISPRGPGDPAARIASLEIRLRALAAPNRQVAENKPPQPFPPPAPKPVVVDPGVEAGRLNAEGRQQESYNLQQAMRTYENALRVQPGNAETVANLARVQGLINSDPKEQAKVLADGIRAFYAAQYAEAEEDLISYVSSTSAKYRGAAHFYIGAIQLYRGILDNPGQKTGVAEKSGNVQRWFKDARNECYRPIDKYLSPVVLNAWNAAPVSTGCAR